MFIQVVTGKQADADEFQRLGNLWDEKVRPVATGYLGSTAGLTDDGRFFVAARFESAEAAAANNDLPQQLEWYQELQKSDATDVQYHDCGTVFTLLGGGSDDAGFVQVMVGTITDRAKFDALSAKTAEMERVFSEWRDDVLGEVFAVHDDGTGYTDVVYFRSEDEARANEQREPTAEVQALMAEMDAAAEVVEYLDLRDPIMR